MVSFPYIRPIFQLPETSEHRLDNDVTITIPDLEVHYRHTPIQEEQPSQHHHHQQPQQFRKPLMSRNSSKQMLSKLSKLRKELRQITHMRIMDNAFIIRV